MTILFRRGETVYILYIYIYHWGRCYVGNIAVRALCRPRVETPQSRKIHRELITG